MEENISEPKSVGRPKGSKKLRSGFRKWQPKTWKVEYEAIILMYAKGMSQKEIAELYDLSPVHVGNIINCEEGQKFIDKIRNSLNQSVKSLEERYKNILELATKNVEEVLIDRDKKLLEKNPMGLASASMKAMEMIDSRLRASSTAKTQNNLIFATEANLDRLLKAMNKSNESDQLHGLTKIGEGDSPISIGPGETSSNTIGNRRSEKVR